MTFTPKVGIIQTSVSKIQADVGAWVAANPINMIFAVQILLTGFTGEWNLLVVVIYA